jgi:hypothetical protein
LFARGKLGLDDEDEDEGVELELDENDKEEDEDDGAVLASSGSATTAVWAGHLPAAISKAVACGFVM